MEKHVRARCTTTGAIAALSERALRLGMFPHWVRADGPVPKQPKSRVQIGTRKTDADAESATEQKE